MPDRYLYRSVIPPNAQSPESNDREAVRTLAAQGQLDQDEGTVESVTVQPDTVTLDGQYRGLYAEVCAAELRELSNASGFGVVPYFLPNAQSTLDGWYSIGDMSVSRVNENLALVQEYTGTLRRVGSRSSHYVTLRSDGGTRQLTHPFGNETSAELGIPANASDVHWVNTETGATATANQQATRPAERGSLAVFDRENATVSNAALIYDVPYDAVDVDVRVWDTRGYGSRDDDDDIPQWQQVYRTTHDAEGDPLAISTGLLRLTLDPSSDPGISAETWDDANTTWTSTSLGSSSWQLDAIDIGHRGDQTLSPARVDARTRWTDGSSTYNLDMTLHRGQGVAQFDRKQTSPNTAVPSGLETLLDPIASASVLHPQQGQGLRPRSEVDA